MASRRILFTTALVACFIFGGCKSAGSVSDAAPAEAGTAAATEVDFDAAMEAWMAAGQPGKHHEHLQPFVGQWTAKMYAWADPNGSPMEYEGAMTNEWALGDRFLRQAYTGDMMGTPFEGRGFMGYNNVDGRYEATWMGSMSSGMTYATGSCSDDGKTFTLLSRETDPMTRETTDLKDVIRIEDDDHHSFTRYYALPDGTFEKGVEIAYTRKD